MELEPNPNFFRKDTPMITTPEQMRKAAVAAVENELTKAKSMFAHLDHYDLYFDGLQDALIRIRAIPIAPQQPVDDQDADMKRIAYKAGYVQAECGLPCPADIDKAFAAWLVEVAQQPVAVTVKPLVWVNVPTGYGPETYEAYSATGFYQVFTDEDSCCGAVLAEFATNQQQFGTTAARSVAHVNGFIDAKAAAQADYEARILSALTIQPADPLSDPRVVALVEAARKVKDAYDKKHSATDSINRLCAALRAIGGEA